MRFYIAFFFTWIHSIMLRYDAVKDNNFIEMVNSMFHFIYHPFKWSPHFYFAYKFKVSIFPWDEGNYFRGTKPVAFYATGFVPPCPIVSQHHHQSWKMNKNGRFSAEGNSFERGTRFTKNDSLYSRPVFPLSNGACRMSLRLSVLEQSAQDWTDVAPFFDPANFPGSNVTPMANNVTCDHVPTAARLFRRSYF